MCAVLALKQLFSLFLFLVLVVINVQRMISSEFQLIVSMSCCNFTVLVPSQRSHSLFVLVLGLGPLQTLSKASREERESTTERGGIKERGRERSKMSV